MHLRCLLFTDAYFSSLHSFFDADHHLLISVFEQLDELIIKLHLHDPDVQLRETKHLTVNLRSNCEITKQLILFGFIFFIWLGEAVEVLMPEVPTLRDRMVDMVVISGQDVADMS